MHDSRIEEQLRAGLRADASELPLTITSAELERRLAARRRAAGGRRLSLVAAVVAAIAVGSIVAVGNGWLGLPSVATAPSPSPTTSPRPTSEASTAPSFKPIPGVARIEPTEGRTILTEVLPTMTHAVTQGSYDGNLPLEAYLVSVKVRCIGPDFTVVEGDRSWPVSCATPGAVADQNLMDMIDIQVLNGHLALRWIVGEDVAYTLLAERVPLPASLPKLEAPDGTIAVDASSPSDRPIAGEPGLTVTQPVGHVADSPTYGVAFVCLGPGDAVFSIGRQGGPDFALSSSLVCDGQVQVDDFQVGVEGGHDIYVTMDTRIAWHVIVTVDATSPSAVP